MRSPSRLFFSLLSNWRFRDLIYLFVLTVGSIFYSGYFVAYADDQLYLPALFQKIDPSLYQNDYISFEPLRTLTIFTDIEFFLYRLFSENLTVSLFPLYFIAKFFIFLGIYQLSLTLFKNRLAAFGSILTLFLPIPLGRTGINTLELSLIPRMLSLGVALLFLNALLRHRLTLSSLLFSLVLLIHPVTAFHIGILGIVYAVAYRQQLFKSRPWIAIAIIISSTLLLVSRYFFQNTSYRLPLWSMSNEWKELFNYRARYLFLKLWQPIHWWYLLKLTTPLLIALVAFRPLARLPGKHFASILLFSGGVLLNLLISYLFLDLRITPLIMRLEPARAILYWVYLGFISFAGIIITVTLRTASPLSWFFATASLLSLPRMNYTALLTWFALWLISVHPKIQDKLKEKRYLWPITIFAIPTSWYLLRRLSQPTWILAIYITVILCTEILQRRKTFFNNIGKEVIIITTVIALSTSILIAHIYSNFPPELYYGGKYPNKILWREYLQQRVHFPNLPQTDWFEAQLWAREHTSPTASFLVPGFFQPGDITGFRVLSRRSVVYDFKDGGMGTYSEQNALEWLRRYKDLEGNENFSEERLLELRKQYGFDYAVRSVVNARLKFPVVFQSTWVIIYEFPKNI